MSNATDLWGQDIHRQAIPRESTGDWLDVHAAQVDETRKPATKTHGKVLFLRGDVSGNVRIPAGRILRTKPDGTGTVYRYVTEALAVLPGRRGFRGRVGGGRGIRAEFQRRAGADMRTGDAG